MRDEKKLLLILRTKLAENGEKEFHVVYEPHRGHDHDYAVYVGPRPEDEDVYSSSELSPDIIGLGDTLVEALQDAIDTVKRW